MKRCLFVSANKKDSLSLHICTVKNSLLLAYIKSMNSSNSRKKTKTKTYKFEWTQRLIWQFNARTWFKSLNIFSPALTTEFFLLGSASVYVFPRIRGAFQKYVNDLRVSCCLIFSSSFQYHWKCKFKCFRMTCVSRISKSLMEHVLIRHKVVDTENVRFYWKSLVFIRSLLNERMIHFLKETRYTIIISSNKEVIQKSFPDSTKVSY